MTLSAWCWGYMIGDVDMSSNTAITVIALLDRTAKRNELIKYSPFRYKRLNRVTIR
jgi:hypothetical protein